MNQTSPSLPRLPVIMPLPAEAVWIDNDGVIENIPFEIARKKLKRQPAMFCHRHFCANRLGLERLEGLDALELFAFTRPTQFCLPSAKGLGTALNLDTNIDAEDLALLIPKACLLLLNELKNLSDGKRDHAASIATMMAGGHWGWAESVLNALGHPMPTRMRPDPSKATIWSRISEIQDYGTPPEAGAYPIEKEDIEKRLKEMLGKGAEMRPSQRVYASSMIPAFGTPKEEGDPALVLTEAGTGTGKTLGYLAAATVWAETNQAPVWISTYTRNLQHQVMAEMGRYYPEQAIRDEKVVIRKGRENYLCLLNFDDALSNIPAMPPRAVALGLMARWAEVSLDGDLTGDGFPAWMIDLFGYGSTIGLADRRGECIHSACPHYQKCFVEKSRQKARNADIVIANHALVMINAAMAKVTPQQDHNPQPGRYIFDEGHHLFDAADKAFSTEFNLREAADLRRWLKGNEGGRKSRSKGLKKRVEDLNFNDEKAIDALNKAVEAASILPQSGWQDRFVEERPHGITETFFFAIHKTIYARVSNPNTLYDIEAELYPLDAKLAKAAVDLAKNLQSISFPLKQLVAITSKALADEADELDTATRIKLESLNRGLLWRINGTVLPWVQLLKDMEAPPKPNGRDGFIDWMSVARNQGQDRDVSLHRHYLDPSSVFSNTVLKPSHGAVITSATLTDANQPTENDWKFTSQILGASSLQSPPFLSSVASPFDYENQTRIFIIQDLNLNEVEQVAAAMGALMEASKGGAIGLFTAIRRLKAVYNPLMSRLTQSQIPLYAQHVDAMSLQTLLQIFKEERHSCLLGTNAVRDGIDVPGEALRLIIFDRVPWPRSNIMFKARAKHFGRDQWTNNATRMSLRQAFGRLVRRIDDRGVFVMLDSRLPSRMYSAFPANAPIRRCSLLEAINETQDFLYPSIN